jgi:hypothetical protein
MYLTVLIHINTLLIPQERRLLELLQTISVAEQQPPQLPSKAHFDHEDIDNVIAPGTASITTSSTTSTSSTRPSSLSRQIVPVKPHMKVTDIASLPTLSSDPRINASLALSAHTGMDPRASIEGPVLVIIRHGKTEHNKLGLFTGWEDAPLAPEGRWANSSEILLSSAR